MSQFTYKPVIDKIFKDLVPVDFEKHIKGTVLDDEKNSINYSISKDLDLFFTFHAIETSTSTGIAPFIYKHLLPDVPVKNKKKCITWLFINIEAHTIEYGKNTVKVRKMWYHEEGVPLTPVINYILQESEKCGSFSIIPVVIYGNGNRHRNIILTERIPKNMRELDPTLPELVLNYYEPYGYLEKNVPIVPKILEKLEKDSKGIIQVNYKNINCPLGGIQTKTEEKDLDVGYCIIYSYFWIYIVLCIITENLKHGRYEPSIRWIKNVEKYYLSKGDAKYLYTIAVSFADMLIKKYMEVNKNEKEKLYYIQQDRRRELLEYIQNKK